MPSAAEGNVLAADVDFCGPGTTLLSTATITIPFNFSQSNYGWIDFDNDWQAFDSTGFGYVEVSIDNLNWTAVRTFDVIDVRNSHEFINISSIVRFQPQVYVRLRSVQPGWHWWWAVDNFNVIHSWIPVELTSFSASVNEGTVNLNWSTATETNNNGFQIERSNGSEYVNLGFVAGTRNNYRNTELFIC